MMTIVTIRETNLDGRQWEARVRTGEREEAISRAIRRLFGRRAFWAGGEYGQVAVSGAGRGEAASTVTGRARIEVGR